LHIASEIAKAHEGTQTVASIADFSFLADDPASPDERAE
jgi:hypothetical protein